MRLQRLDSPFATQSSHNLSNLAALISLIILSILSLHEIVMARCTPDLSGTGFSPYSYVEVSL